LFRLIPGQPDGHAVMSISGLGLIGAEYPIPDRKIEPEITVGFTAYDGMMHPVHVRRDQYDPYYRIKPKRQTHIGMIEHSHAIENNFKQDHGQHRHAEQRHRQYLDEHGKQDFDRVETQAGRHINILVGMVYHMQPPQYRHGMKQYMLGVNDAVQYDDRDGNRSRMRYVQPVHHTEICLPGPDCGAHRPRGNQQPNQKYTDQR